MRHSRTLEISDRRRYWEISAVIATGLGKFLFVDILPMKFWYILTAISGWTIYIVIRTKKVKGLKHYWGFSQTNLKQLFLLLTPIAAILITSFWIYGTTANMIVVNWHILLVIILYPVWGIIQQLLMVGIVASNLKDLQTARLRTAVVVVMTAILFSIVHFPSLPLVAATFLMGIVYAILFLRYRNIIPLGLYHGWLGGFFYFFVLGRDPWNEVLTF